MFPRNASNYTISENCAPRAILYCKESIGPAGDYRSTRPQPAGCARVRQSTGRAVDRCCSISAGHFMFSRLSEPSSTSPGTTSETVLVLRRGGECPESLYRGTIASCHDHVYCSSLGSNSVHQYTLSSRQLRALPPCPAAAFALVVVDGSLFTVESPHQPGADLGNCKGGFSAI